MPFSLRRQHNVLVSSFAAMLALAPVAVQAQVQAQPVTRFTTYMHSGPGKQFSVVDEIPNQTPLTPDTCSDGWCRVRFGAAFGWIEQKTLITGPSTAQPAPGEHPLDCTDFARTGWPDSGDLQRVCIFKPNKPVEIDKPAG